jgi:hypothetical protein
VTEPTDSQRDGSGRDQLAQTGPDTEPETRWADADEAAPDASAEMTGSGEARDVSGETTGSGEARDDVDDADAVADDPEHANGPVAAALAELDAAADWPPADQVAAFTAAHEALQATLARIDDH